MITINLNPNTNKHIQQAAQQSVTNDKYMLCPRSGIDNLHPAKIKTLNKVGDTYISYLGVCEECDFEFNIYSVFETRPDGTVSINPGLGDLCLPEEQLKKLGVGKCTCSGTTLLNQGCQCGGT